MKIKLYISTLLIFICSSLKLYSQDVEFESSNIEFKDEGNLIFAFNSKTVIKSQDIIIESDKVIYNKRNNTLVFYENVLLKDLKKNLILNGNNISYDLNTNTIFGEGKTNFNIDNKYKIDSQNVFYNKNTQEIFSNELTEIEDLNNNFYHLEKYFKFDIVNETILSERSNILDNKNNKYIFEDLIINLKDNHIAGKEIKIEFENSYFGNNRNDPVLKGRSAHSNDEHLKVYKAVFSTCNIKNKDCRGWELNTEEFNHDKTKKIFEYKNSWLKIFDYKVFYLPYFNHPDPTVKRRTGFLTPSYSSSESLGTSITIPYFRVISKDKDMTFNPRIYADKSFLIQNEYRQALERSQIKSDFSVMIGQLGTKSHFFFNQIGKHNEYTNYELNFQTVKGDNYLKNHNLKESSDLIKDENLLLSNIDINWKLEESSLDTSFKIYEDLSRNYHDRYQFIFPDFSFKKNLRIPEKYFGRFDFYSYGYSKNYNTNVLESVITNDFLFKSNEYINSKGIVTEYDLLLKNSSSYSNNSSNFDENAEYNVFGIAKFDASLPLQKKLIDHTNYLKPVISFRYSPNGNSNLTSKDIFLNYDSAFNLNRIGTSYEVEGGESLSFGLEFKRTNNFNQNVLDLKVANVVKASENFNLPSKSKLNKTRSDIFGDLSYKINKNINLGYFFSYDKDLEYSNLDGLNLRAEINNFFTDFNYYAEGNDLLDKETIQYKTKYKFNKENILSFEIAKDLKNDFTEFYDLNYEYITDCLSLSLKYNTSFYSDGNIEPNKSLTFLIKIIPFTELGVSNVGNILGK